MIADSTMKLINLCSLMIFVLAVVDGKEATTPNDVDFLLQSSMMQNFYREQELRSSGQSGIKIVRQRRTSDEHNYGVESHAGETTAAIHDHSEYKALAGKGQTTVVMNGVQFSTRHDDYHLEMASQNSQEFEKTEEIPFPDVPPLRDGNKDTKITEMRKWFKAFKDQDHTKLDYRNYFKPILCYIEGAWYQKKTNKIDGGSKSARHFIDADSWSELDARLRFVGYSGSKDIAENLASLPSKIIDMINGTIPVIARWKYRILCHPIRRDLPVKHLKVVDDIASRMMMGKTLEEHQNSRAARFVLKDDEKDSSQETLLDTVMGEIPGMNNYPGKIFDTVMENKVVNPDGTEKDISRYHRTYNIKKKDAMGASTIHRGYNDPYLFAASTTHDEIAGVQLEKCEKLNGGKEECRLITQKWTYAIPLEIIYLTPLTKWNPMYLNNLEGNKYKKPHDGGRTGGCNKDQALLGFTNKIFYKTPVSFYDGDGVKYKSGKGADTGSGSICVMGTKEPQRVKAAGIYTFLHNIIGVGRIRQRYPIYPVHGEGSSVWKELNAFKQNSKS